MNLASLLRCPRCRKPIEIGEVALCAEGHRFRVIDGIPILVIEDEDEATRRQHEHQRDLYDQKWGGGRQYRLENWQKAYLERLEPLWETSGVDGPFIDIGAGGDAYTVLEAARRGIPAVGCDLSLESMLSAKRFAQARGLSDRCLFVVATVENLPFADTAFGAAAGIAVLEHVPDDRSSIAELARVMRPSARVYFTVPNTLADAPLILSTLYQRHDRTVGHMRHYAAADLEAKCSEAGLQPTRVVYTVHWEKVIQLGMDLALTRAGIPHDRLWWWLERRDASHHRRPGGLHLHLYAEKVAH